MSSRVECDQDKSSRIFFVLEKPASHLSYLPRWLWALKKNEVTKKISLERVVCSTGAALEALFYLFT